MTPEKAKAPAVRSAEAFKVIYRTAKNGINMKDTAIKHIAQACDAMRIFMVAQAGVVKDYYHLMPAAQRDEISRLGMAMWEQVEAMQSQALVSPEALNDPAFRAFKEKLIAKPKRIRKPKKTAVVLQLAPKRQMTAAEAHAWQQNNKAAA